MSKGGVNKVILIGNLGADPEIRYSQNNAAITNISIATSIHWKDKQTGEAKELTEWHRCVAYRKLAEIIGEYGKKGNKVFVEGRLQTRKWQGQDGVDRYTTEIVIGDFQILDSQNSGGQQGRSAQPAQQQNRAPVTGTNTRQPNPQAQNNLPPDDFDDDIPFS